MSKHPPYELIEKQREGRENASQDKIGSGQGGKRRPCTPGSVVMVPWVCLGRKAPQSIKCREQRIPMTIKCGGPLQRPIVPITWKERDKIKSRAAFYFQTHLILLWIGEVVGTVQSSVIRNRKMRRVNVEKKEDTLQHLSFWRRTYQPGDVSFRASLH